MTVVWAAIAAVTVALVNCEVPEVKTTSGKVNGLTVEVDGVELNAFYGVPFAKPPLHKLRYAEPVPFNNPSASINATKMPPSCYQLPTGVPFGWQPEGVKSEDCLYLNIWAPAKSTKNLRTVMVWFPGGAFIAGGISIDYYNGKEFAAIGDVVVVEVNSRVGNLGYLNLNIPEANGNQGLFDQYLALKWIQENIANFGGDPESVTLLGHSAGSISISLHLSSPISRPLFKRAIMISGTSFYPPFAMDLESSLALSQKYAEMVKCADNVTTVHNDPYSILECLKTKETFALYRKESHLNVNINFFYPRIGNAMIPESPIASLKKGSIKKTEVLLGNILEEGNLFLNLLLPLYFFEEHPEVNKTSAMFMILSALNSSGAQIENVHKLLGAYFDSIENEDDYVAVRKAVAEFLGDLIFFCPTLFWAKEYSLHSPNIYYYLYTHPPSVVREERQSWMKITHFDEVPYMFGFPIYSKLKYTEEERRFSKKLVESWTNFAKTGSPRINDYKNWPLFTVEDPLGMELSPGKRDSFLPNPSTEKCNDFWWPMFFSHFVP